MRKEKKKYDEFALALELAIEEEGWKSAEAAYLLNISYPTLKLYLSGRQLPGLKPFVNIETRFPHVACLIREKIQNGSY